MFFKPNLFWAIPAFCLLIPATRAAFAFTTTDPTQCDDLSVSWTGGTPPFSLVLDPVFGSMRNVSIPATSFSNGAGSFTFQLPLASGQKFVMTMSDATSFGSGGTTNILTTGSSQGGSCNTTDPGVSFSFQLNSALQQCGPYVFSGYNGATQPVTITGTIPGGQSFLLFPPLGSTSYTWNADVAAGTSLLFTMVDAQGRNGGTSDIKTVGITDDSTCLNAQSPSSTAVSLSPTSTSLAAGGSQTASPSPSAIAQQKTSIAAIAGTVIGALIFLAVVITLGLFFLRKRRDNGNSRHPINRDIDLTYDPGHTYDNYPYYSTATSGSASAAPLTSVQGVSGYDSSSFTDGAQTQQYYQQASYTPSTPYTTSEYHAQSQHRYQDNSEYQSQTPYPEASQYLPSLHSMPQSHSQQGSEADPFNPYELTSDPSVIRPYDVSEAGSTTMSSAQRKAAMAGVQAYTPSRFIVHTDVEDELPPPNHDGIVELPPQYSERRAPPSLINATPGSSSQTHPQRVS